MTSEQNWGQVVDAVMAAHGRLDILFNNAGVSFSRKVEDITVDIWDRELGVEASWVTGSELVIDGGMTAQ